MGSINLAKGQKIELKKEDGSSLRKIRMGLGWDVATGIFGIGGGGNIDLDASCLMFDDNKQIREAVYFGKLRSSCNSVNHSGDNLTGAGDGDDEVIHVDLDGVPAHIKSLVFTVNSYRGQSFDKVKNCFARLVDSTTNNEISIFKLAEKGSHTGLIMAKVYRHNGGWKMSAIGVPCNGRTYSDIVPSVIEHL